MMRIENARKVGARTLDEIEAELHQWTLGGDGCIEGGIYYPVAADEPWPIREILIELLEGHGVDCSGIRRAS